MNVLDKKINHAIKLLQVFAKDKVVEVSYSGGKDSDVILELAKMAGINYRAIYKNTTIDPPHTIAHCKSKGVEIAKPKEKFFDLVKRKGIPTMRARFCCEVMKEYKILDDAVQGIRRSESTKRKRLYSEPIICRTYGSKKNHVNVCLPILEWTDKDVEQFIKARGIKCHPLYYDERGNFHVERRLGCIGCPLKSDNGIADFLQRPKFLKRLVECGKIWWDTHPNAASREKFCNIFDLVYHNLFCTSYDEYLRKKRRNLFGEVLDCKKYIEEYFDIKI
jgi:phosphoadenosine phosphosulfate reductase